MAGDLKCLVDLKAKPTIEFALLVIWTMSWGDYNGKVLDLVRP